MLGRVLFWLLLLIVIPDTYIYCLYVRRWTKVWWKRLLHFLPSLLLLAYLCVVWQEDDFHAANQPMVGTLMVVFLAITVPKMLFTLLDAIGIGIGHASASIRKASLSAPQDVKEETAEGVPPDSNIRRYMRIIAMTLAICSLLMLLYGYLWGRNRYVVDEQEIYFSNLPKAFDGYRILHFSDLHIGTFGDGHEADVATVVDLINRQKCDMVVFTGDIVNYEYAELKGYEDVLKKIKAKDGVYSVMGNHDYDIYLKFKDEKAQKADIERIKKAERRYGWTLLMNNHRVIRRGNDSIAVVGTENGGLPPWPDLADLSKATHGLAGLERSDSMYADSIDGMNHTFSVLLTHDPTYWRRRVVSDTRIDLTLAGHTHAGQFKLLGWSPVRWRYSEWSGVYTEGAQVINVTDGIGQIMLPLRFGAWPEVDVITLKKTK